MIEKKRILIVFIILVICNQVYSLDFLSSEYEIDFSYYLDASETTVKHIGEDWIVDEFNPFVEISLSIRVYAYELFFIGGTVSTVTDFLGSSVVGGFTPFFSWYLFETGLKLKVVELYFEHICSHTSTPYGYAFRLITGVDKSYSKIGIRYSSRGRGDQIMRDPTL